MCRISCCGTCFYTMRLYNMKLSARVLWHLCVWQFNHPLGIAIFPRAFSFIKDCTQFLRTTYNVTCETKTIMIIFSFYIYIHICLMISLSICSRLLRMTCEAEAIALREIHYKAMINLRAYYLQNPAIVYTAACEAPNYKRSVSPYTRPRSRQRTSNST